MRLNHKENNGMCRRPSSAFVILLVVSTIAAAEDAAEALVHVSGEGVVRVAPDQVVTRLTLTTTDDDLIRVRENSDKDARTIVSFAEKYGVDESGLEVSRLELSLNFNEQLRRQIYQVERDVTVTLDDLTKLDALLSGLLPERNLKIVGINFTASNARQHEFEARSHKT